jgi:hypothetical protein
MSEHNCLELGCALIWSRISSLAQLLSLYILSDTVRVQKRPLDKVG